MVVMVFVVMVVMIMVFMFVMLAAEQHDDAPGEAQDHEAGDQDQPGLCLVEDQRVAQPDPRRRQSPDDQRMANGRRAAQQRRLPRRAARGDHKRGHHALAMAGLQRMQRPQQNGEGQIGPGIGGVSLNDGGDVWHEAHKYLARVFSSAASEAPSASCSGKRSSRRWSI